MKRERIKRICIINKNGSHKKYFLIILLVFLLCSCGYQLVREKGIYGGDISSVYISVFKNMTYEPHISQYVTDAFSKELRFNRIIHS